MKANVRRECSDAFDQLTLGWRRPPGHVYNQPTLLAEHGKSSKRLQILDQQDTTQVGGYSEIDFADSGRPQAALGVTDGAPDTELAVEDRNQQLEWLSEQLPKQLLTPPSPSLCVIDQAGELALARLQAMLAQVHHPLAGT